MTMRALERGRSGVRRRWVQRMGAFAALAAVAAGSSAAGGPQEIRKLTSSYRAAHEKAIVEEFMQLLALPNVAANVSDVDRNAAAIRAQLERRGFTTQLLRARPQTPAAVFAEMRVPGAKRTLLLYAHYDGQPVSQPGWRSQPFVPVVRSGNDARTATDVSWKTAPALDPEWRIYARSASDDKAPIQAILSAVDALKAEGKNPAVNIKLFLEGEEEAGSTNLTDILRQNRALLAADLFVLSDGPRHSSGKMQVFFGARGIAELGLTVYGPARPLHDGHYGNWVPSPAAALVNLLSQLRDDNANILIPGIMDQVRPLTAAETAAIAALPRDDERLRAELAVGRSEGKGSLPEQLMLPALNIRGLRAGNVGASATNTIVTSAEASIDFRLVPDQQPEAVKAATESYLQKLGWFVVDREPSLAERRAHPKVVKAVWKLGYPAYRTRLGTGESAIRAVEKAFGQPLIRVPMLGGSVPMAIFADELQMPVLGLPIANADNNQHAENENIRIGNLWDAIDMFGVLISDPD